MALPGNGIFVVRGEISTLMTAMKRGSRWNTATYMDVEKDGILKLLVDLKQILNRIEDLRLIDPQVFLSPFLEVIRTDETTGVVTSLALAAINKFLTYGLIDPTTSNLPAIVESIVDTVTHARFMGTDQSSNGVTLFRVVEVLHTLMRSPEGSSLTNESVCEVMLSCFKICFEPRLNELLRRTAERALKDIVLLLFMRLPQFTDDRNGNEILRKYQMMASAMEKDHQQRQENSKLQKATLHKSNSQSNVSLKAENGKLTSTEAAQSPSNQDSTHLKPLPLATTPATPAGNILDMQGKITQTPSTPSGSVVQNVSSSEVTEALDDGETVPSTDERLDGEHEPQEAINQSSEYINSVGVRFTQQNSINVSENVMLLPYGIACIQELFRFLIMLCNPLDKQNTDTMIHMGLSLLSIAFEVGADTIGKYDTLLDLIKDDLCRNLIALMNSERLTIFAADLQLCFLIFESLRGHLKFQMEAYLNKLSEIIASDNPKIPYELRELALDNLLQLWSIPGFVAELYINYDCDLYCTDIFENLTKLLSKYTLSATNAVLSTHVVAMDTLISVIDGIEKNCAVAKNSEVAPKLTNSSSTSKRHSRQNSARDSIVIEINSVTSCNERKSSVENISKFISNSATLRLPAGGAAEASITQENLREVKQKKRLLMQGTELFNQRPDKGIQYLQENGILNTNLDPKEVASLLRENPGLDKKMIGEYISKKKNVELRILETFVESFDFTGLRVDQALRLYLETFRLPGEAPLIFLVLEHFANHWHTQNNEPFANSDAAFSLAYAIIMLNMDQHNSNAKRLNVPMTLEDFLKNLRGLNGGSDFDQEMLSNVFHAIKNEEIVMPAEQTGLVRENYLWKVLLRRGLGSDGKFIYVQEAAYDLELFNIIWRASLSTLSFMFDKITESGYQRTLAGFTKCAAIAAHYNLYEDFDALILTLCKFTTLLNAIQQDSNPLQNEIVQAVNFGLNPKAQAAMRTVFMLVHDYGDYLRESWKHILDLHLQLFRLKLLPKSILEVEDFCESNGKTLLVLDKPNQKQELSLFSSLYSYLSSEGQREPSYEEQEFIKIGKKCIKDCQLEQVIQESKFVQLESLQELLKNILSLIKPPTANKSVGLPYAEDITVFWMELLVKIVVQNRDRMISMWPSVRDQMYTLLISGASYGYDYLLNRSIVAVLKLAIYLMRNEELCPIVLQSMRMLLALQYDVLQRISKQISVGIYELLKTSAQNIHSEEDWQIIFNILECVGAGAQLPEFAEGLSTRLQSVAKSDGALSSEEDSGLPDKEYMSDSEALTKPQKNIPVPVVNLNPNTQHLSSPTIENWILVNKDNELSTSSRPQSPPTTSSSSAGTSPLVYNCRLTDHSPFALFKCWDSLAFIVRNVAHITPYNFESCVRCIRTFVEACRDGGIRQQRKLKVLAATQNTAALKRKHKRFEREHQRKAAQEEGDGESHNDEDETNLAQQYETLSIQLLDLMYTLYTRTAQIFRWWAEEGCTSPQCSALWAQGWCPLLQGIARLAMDRRREVRTYAISCLQQRALLVHDLQTLSGLEWASCFREVLFPLLNELLPQSESLVNLETQLLEESRIRIATIMSKVLLHHLTPLIELGPAFNELWIEVLNYIERFLKVGSDMLSEQMQEILKNMLLVMHSVGVFHNNDGSLRHDLWDLTWLRIGEFLPNLKTELFYNEGRAAPNVTTNHESSDANAVVTDTKPSQPEQLLQNINSNQNVESTSPISPLESPRHSILLQPPAMGIFQSQSLIFAQSTTTQKNMPVLIPQTSTAHALLPEPTVASKNIITVLPSSIPDNVNTPIKSPTSFAPIAGANGTLDTNLLTSQNDAFPSANVNSAYDSCSFAIDLPETPPPVNIYGEPQQFKSIDATTNLNAFENKHGEGINNDGNSSVNLVQSVSISGTTKYSAIEGSRNPSGSALSNAGNSAVPKIDQTFLANTRQALTTQTHADIFQEYVQNPYNIALQQQHYTQSSQENLHEHNSAYRHKPLEFYNTSMNTPPINFYNVDVDQTAKPFGTEALYNHP